MDTDKVDAAQKRMENGKIQENNKDAGLERSGGERDLKGWRWNKRLEPHSPTSNGTDG